MLGFRGLTLPCSSCEHHRRAWIDAHAAQVAGDLADVHSNPRWSAAHHLVGEHQRRWGSPPTVVNRHHRAGWGATARMNPHRRADSAPPRSRSTIVCPPIGGHARREGAHGGAVIVFAVPGFTRLRAGVSEVRKWVLGLWNWPGYQFCSSQNSGWPSILYQRTRLVGPRHSPNSRRDSSPGLRRGLRHMWACLHERKAMGQVIFGPDSPGNSESFLFYF
jgi:hypothetical protein